MARVFEDRATHSTFQFRDEARIILRSSTTLGLIKSLLNCLIDLANADSTTNVVDFAAWLFKHDVEFGGNSCTELVELASFLRYFKQRCWHFNHAKYRSISPTTECYLFTRAYS